MPKPTESAETSGSVTEAAVEVAALPLWRRPAVFRLLLIALLAEIGYAVLNISTMPVYLRDDRNFGAFSVSVILVAFLLSEAVLKGPCGHLADKFGRRTMILFGPALTIGTSLLSLAVPHSWERAEIFAFIALRLVDGVGAAMLWPAAFALIGDVVDDRERQQALSLLNMCYLVGIALALPIGGVVEDLTSAKSAGLYLAASIFAAVTLYTWRALPKDEIRRETTLDDHHEGVSVRDFLQSLRKIPGYLTLAVVTFAGIGFPMAIIKLFAQDEFALSASKFGLLVMPGAIAMAVLSVPMSHLGERLGRAKAVHLGLGLCTLGLAFLSLGAFFTVFRQTWTLALAGIPVGLGFLLTIPAWLTAVSDLDPQRRAANLGSVMTAQGLGAIIGAPLGGAAYEHFVPFGVKMGLGTSFGHYSPFLGCTIFVAIGWLLSFRILRPPRPIRAKTS